MTEISLTITLIGFFPNQIGVVRKMALKGRSPTVSERLHMSKVADLGCIVCRNNGLGFVPAEIHHIEGKTKKDCHFKVLPLCFAHHRRGNSDHPISRHPWKKRFEKAYGTESELLAMVEKYLEDDECELF
jgi:hypothetical protein